METSRRARRRKLDTAKTDLKPPLAVLRRAGCLSRDGIISWSCSHEPLAEHERHQSANFYTKVWEKVSLLAESARLMT